NLDSMLDVQVKAKTKNQTQYTEATFKTTRLIDGHTVETTQGGVLDLKISHRFGQLNDGFYNMFGLDAASIRIGMDYGLTNRLSIGGGRSSFEKQYDGFLKYRLVRQSEGKKRTPVSVTLLASMMFQTDTVAMKNEKNIPVSPKTEDKFSYAYQVLIARKFNSNFSLQLMPSLVHENLVDSSFNSNDIFAIGAGARFKLTQRSSLNVEYYYQLPGTKLPGTYNTFSIGYEIETGGHVFQLHLSNSTGMTEKTFIAENTGRWSKGDIHFGFNISRVFTIRKPKDIKM
ncbi:MAG: hypothetical protein JO072_14990, partial [Parafilimonas sp.]|nr:hypothetical protein [Parafilimonas sp.]